MEIIFWISLFIVFYTFIGYGIILYALVKIKRLIAGTKKSLTTTADTIHLPTLTVIVAAYNEEVLIASKIENTLALSYPAELIKYIFVTDGSDDQTAAIAGSYKNIMHLHTGARQGKVNAMHRALQYSSTDIIVFTDANTTLNKESLMMIAGHYSDNTVGAVAGEKRVHVDEVSDATAGEGFYWKYESKLKEWDYELYSVVGAAGELFSIRRNLYVPVPPDTILDDFMISLQIAAKGYRIAYEPGAYATENSSADTREELKRKIRIAAGGIQSILRLKSLLNPFNNLVLSFQYLSHRVLRWTITPFLMILVLILNAVLALQQNSPVYWILFAGQFLFYGLAVTGWVIERMEIKIKIAFIPFYFCLMNYAVIRGISRFVFGSQSASWEKAKRK